MKQKRIVIVTYNWPPRNAIGTHRPFSWAKYWSLQGARVTVLTAQKQPFDAPLDLEESELPDVDVIEVPYNISPVLNSSFTRTKIGRNILRTAKRWILRHGMELVDPRAGWRQAAKPILQRIANGNDVVVSTFGPETAHLIASDMKVVNPSICWVADYRDLWSQQHTGHLPTRQREKLRKLELATVGTHADLITTVSADLCIKLQSLINKPVIEITNGFDFDVNELRERYDRPLQNPSRPFRIVHTGTIYPGHRDPKPLLDALFTLQSTGKINNNEITIDFYGSRLDSLEKFKKSPIYSPFIRIMGHVPRQVSLKAQEDADLLLLLESSAPEAKGVLTGKIFEYIAAGKPILCIGSHPSYEIGQLLHRTRTGTVITTSNSSQIAKTILQTIIGEGLYEDYKPNICHIMTYSRENQATKLLDIICKM